MRARILSEVDESLARDAARAEALLEDGTVLSARVEHARGSLARPLTDAELNAKFDMQARGSLAKETAERLRDLCRGLTSLPDLGRALAPLWPHPSVIGSR